MSVSRLPKGLCTDPRKSNGNLGEYVAPDPTRVHAYFDDFDTYTAGQWTVTETQASATQALTDGDGGLLLVTNTATENDLVALQKVGESFLMAAGKQAWFKARFKLSDVTQSDFLIGLQITDTTPFDATDGIWFQTDDGDALLDVYCRKNATTGSTSASGIATLVDDTFVEVGWYYDGKSELKYFVNNVHIGTLDASSAYLPDTELTVSFALMAGDSAAETVTVDYIFAAKER